MLRKIRSAKIVLALIIVFLSIFSLAFLTSAEPENNNSVTIRFAVHILDIDQSQKLVELKIHVFVDNFPYNESKVGVWVIGAGDTMVWCNNTGPTMIDKWSYKGESKQTTWLLEGMGEQFPFDSYNLRFKVYSIEYLDHDFTLLSEEHQAVFAGPRTYSLNDLWSTDNGLIPIRYIGTDEISFIIQRGSNALVIAILQFLVPIVGCYYLLGSTLMLDPKKQLAERLRIHLSLFVFVPTFLIATQTFLPYRSSLAFPEFLLVNLIVSNMIFGIFSILAHRESLTTSKRQHKQKGISKFENKWDGLTSFVSVVVFTFIYLSTTIGKMSIQASLVMILIIPSYIYSYYLMTPKEQLVKEKRLLIPIALILIAAFILILLWLRVRT